MLLSHIWCSYDTWKTLGGLIKDAVRMDKSLANLLILRAEFSMWKLCIAITKWILNMCLPHTSRNKRHFVNFLQLNYGCIKFSSFSVCLMLVGTASIFFPGSFDGVDALP